VADMPHVLHGDRQGEQIKTELTYCPKYPLGQALRHWLLRK